MTKKIENFLKQISNELKEIKLSDLQEFEKVPHSFIKQIYGGNRDKTLPRNDTCICSPTESQNSSCNCEAI